MNDATLFFCEMATLFLLSACLLLSYLLRHAPEGFQHHRLFYFGTPPENLVPCESVD